MKHLALCLLAASVAPAALAGDNLVGGRIEVWMNGQFGAGSAPAGRFTKLVFGVAHGAALRPSGEAVCWGKIGTWDGAQPMIAPVGTLFSDIASGNAHVAGLRLDGGVRVWGSTESGLHNGPSGTFTKIASGNSHSAALRSNGAVACWGYNAYGQCNAPSESFVDVTCTHMNTVALRSDGTAVKWGQDSGWWTSSPPPPLVRLADSTWSGGTAIGWDALGNWHAWTVDGSCTGFSCGQSGGIGAPPSSTPFNQILTSGASAIAIRPDGYLAGWGSNQSYSNQGPLSFQNNKQFQAIAIGSAVGGIRVPCPADLDDSDYVDSGDIAIALLEFGACDSCNADLDESGEVDAGDVALMLLDFGRCP